MQRDESITSHALPPNLPLPYPDQPITGRHAGIVVRYSAAVTRSTYNGVNRLIILAVRSRGSEAPGLIPALLSDSYSRMIFKNRCCGLPPAVRSLEAFRSFTRSDHSICSYSEY